MSLNETHSIDANQFNIFEKFLMTIIFASIGVLGVIGNVIVLIVSIRKQNYKFVTNCYIINLAITDLLFLIISIPLTTYLGLFDTWILSSFISCRVHIYIAHVLLQATCYTLAAMSIDRYIYVISSHPRPRWRTPFNAFIICILIWIISIAVIFPYASLSSSETELNITNDCLISSSHPLFASCLVPFFAFYIFPLLIIALCYTKLWFYMKHISKSITQYKTNLLNRRRSSSKRRHLSRTLFSLTCAFAICWFPIHLLELLNCQDMLTILYINHTRLFNAIRVTAHALSYFNSCLNPILYALYNRDSLL